MPNRGIKESICTSKSISHLSPQAEVLFFHLIVKCDDFGLYYGDLNIIKNTCFPLIANSIKCNQLGKWLTELVNEGMVLVYTANGEQYLSLTNWEKHQKRRAKTSKFPLPNSDAVICKQMQTDDCTFSRDTRHETRDKNTNKATDVDVFFDSLWKLYPRKEGKANVTEKQKERLYEIGYDELKRAVERYCQEKEGIERKFIKQGSTFFNSGYVDYLDGAYEGSQPKAEFDN